MRGRPLVEYQAGRGRMPIQLAVRTHEAPFGGGHLPTEVYQLTLGTHQRHRVRESTHDLQLLQRPVGFTRRQRRMHGATHAESSSVANQPQWA